MKLRQQLLPVISSLFLCNAVFALDDSGYLALTNAGYVSVTMSTEAASHAEVEGTDIYRDQLIIDEPESPETAPAVAFGAANDE
jgi:hypothetical protein